MFEKKIEPENNPKKTSVVMCKKDDGILSINQKITFKKLRNLIITHRKKGGLNDEKILTKKKMNG